MHVIDPVTVYVNPILLSQSVTLQPYVVPDQLTVVSNNRYSGTLRMVHGNSRANNVVEEPEFPAISPGCSTRTP